MSNLKNQTVYVVTTLNRNNDGIIGYEIFALREDATRAAAIVNATTKKTGEYAYYDKTIIF